MLYKSFDKKVYVVFCFTLLAYSSILIMPIIGVPFASVALIFSDYLSKLAVYFDDRKTMLINISYYACLTYLICFLLFAVYQLLSHSHSLMSALFYTVGISLWQW